MGITNRSFSTRIAFIIYLLAPTYEPWIQVGAFSRHYNEPVRNLSSILNDQDITPVDRSVVVSRIKISANTCTSTSTHLYKGNRGHQESRGPGKGVIYSSVTATSPTLQGDGKESKSNVNLRSSSAVATPRIKKVPNKISSVFGVISNSIIGVVADSSRNDNHSSRSDDTDTAAVNPAGRHYPSTHEEQTQVITLVDISWLKAHEEIVGEERVHALYKSTLKWDAYKLPLLVDVASGAILDGHHRYHVGCRLGLSRLPVILVDYLNDDSINVDVWPECGLDYLSKEEVIEMSLSGDVFPPKTSKHDFVSSFTGIHVPLEKLR